jgi:hypothetical protein
MTTAVRLDVAATTAARRVHAKHPLRSPIILLIPVIRLNPYHAAEFPIRGKARLPVHAALRGMKPWARRPPPDFFPRIQSAGNPSLSCLAPASSLGKVFGLGLW